MIHPQAIVSPKARLADDVEVGPFSIIGDDVEIDSGTWIGPHVVINGHTSIGKNNRIFQFSSVGEIPQDKKYHNEPTRLVIGDGNTIREYCTFNRGTVDDNGVTQIGNNNWFMAYAHVAHDCIIGSDTIFANAASAAGHVHVGDFAVLGGFTSIHQFTHIGDHAFSGLGSVITRDVPPYMIVAGNRAVPGGINKEGLQRKGFSDESIRGLHRAYRALFKSKKSRADAVQELEMDINTFSEVKAFVDFVLNSERGVVR